MADGRLTNHGFLMGESGDLRRLDAKKRVSERKSRFRLALLLQLRYKIAKFVDIKWRSRYDVAKNTHYGILR